MVLLMFMQIDGRLGLSLSPMATFGLITLAFAWDTALGILAARKRTSQDRHYSHYYRRRTAPRPSAADGLWAFIGTIIALAATGLALYTQFFS